jgi:hypothetical protein
MSKGPHMRGGFDEGHILRKGKERKNFNFLFALIICVRRKRAEEKMFVR